MPARKSPSRPAPAPRRPAARPGRPPAQRPPRQRPAVAARAKRPAEVRTALVLQGGAGLGAYEAGVLRALIERGGPLPEVVTGCSIGAIMGAILLAPHGDPRAHLAELWDQLAIKVNPFLPGLVARSFALPLPVPLGGNDSPLYRLNPMLLAMPAQATYVYEPGPLLAAIERWVNFAALNRAASELIVTAVDVATGRLHEFSNRTGGLEPQHIMASASLPPVYPATRIGKADYWDGALISNTPLRPAINAIEAHNQARRAARWELLIVDLFAPQERPLRDLSDVAQRLFELMFFGKFSHDLKLYEWMNAQLDLMIAVDRALPRDSPVRAHPAYRKLQQHRRIDALRIVRPSDPAALGGAADLSREAIALRLAMGYADGSQALAAR